MIPAVSAWALGGYASSAYTANCAPIRRIRFPVQFGYWTRLSGTDLDISDPLGEESAGRKRQSGGYQMRKDSF